MEAGPAPRNRPRPKPPDPDLPPVGVDFELLAEEEQFLLGPAEEQRASAGMRSCPVCGKHYGADYADAFCTCGVELGQPAAPVSAEVSTRVVPPPPGTLCLILVGADKRPLQYFRIDKDVIAIGRADPLHGHFPDIDVSTWLDAVSARKVSRRHALILRQRQDGSLCLRPLAGNTGTQINQDMVEAKQDYPLVPGTRLILGGAVRLRFEVISENPT
jgi:hypothetical protein